MDAKLKNENRNENRPNVIRAASSERRVARRLRRTRRAESSIRVRIAA